MALSSERHARHAFFISLFCHIGVFSIFVFTLAAHPEKKKPFCVFLGSILRKDDLAGFDAAENTVAALPLPTTPSHLDLIKDSQKIHTFSSLEKPAPTKMPFSQSKPTFKPKMEEPTAASAETTKGGLGVTSTVPTRIPLKLNLP